MKHVPKFSLTVSACFSAVIWALFSMTSEAQILTSEGEFTQNSINVATGVDPTTLGYSYDGYTFFTPFTTGGGSGPDLYSVPSFTSLGAFVGASGAFSSSYAASLTAGNKPTFATDTDATPNANNRYSGGYSTITINGTSYHTGVNYLNGHASTSAASPTVLGAIQLQNTVPTSFNVGFLLDNSGTNQGQFDQDVSLTLETSAGTALSTVTLETSDMGAAANNFYYANVANAVAGDYLVLNAYNVYGSTPPTGNTDVSIGGIVFSAVPEPSTWALLGVSLIGGIAFLAKRRSSTFKA